MMRRREILVVLCGATIACPRAAIRAQRKAMPVIGFLHFGSPDGFAYQIDALRQGLAENGMLTEKTSPSKPVGQRVISSSCRHWPRISSLPRSM